MGKSAPMLTVKELEAKVIKAVVDGTNKVVEGTKGNAVANAYNHSTLFELRAKMLESYYNYLTDLKDGKDIQLAKQTYLYRGI